MFTLMCRYHCDPNVVETTGHFTIRVGTILDPSLGLLYQSQNSESIPILPITVVPLLANGGSYAYWIEYVCCLSDEYHVTCVRVSCEQKSVHFLVFTLVQWCVVARLLLLFMSSIPKTSMTVTLLQYTFTVSVSRSNKPR